MLGRIFPTDDERNGTMSNMSYCRFQNTLSDLQDCDGALEEFFDGTETLSGDEIRAAASLIETCQKIAMMAAERLNIANPGEFPNVSLDECELYAPSVRSVLTEINNAAKDAEDDEPGDFGHDGFTRERMAEDDDA